MSSKPNAPRLAPAGATPGTPPEVRLTADGAPFGAFAALQAAREGLAANVAEADRVMARMQEDFIRQHTAKLDALMQIEDIDAAIAKLQGE
jgi:hypothetical protein